ncbi:MAG: serine/threonine protein kinase [Pirellulaceae bacterium]|jgi:serine/threonine-protein kinase|nr:serine/threonine protein kinase [Pirellulaceae bacterium]
MAAAGTLDHFLTLLHKSRLLTEAAFAAARTQVRGVQATTAEQAADALVAQGVLTKYQANRLLEGRRRGLFIDDYKIIELLGCGGMGYLYRAQELKTDWEVALKVLADRFRFDKGRLTRFQLEAEAGLKLSHPNILRTKAIRRSEDIYGVIHYMVMELVKGVSLRELLEIRRRTLNWRQSCDVICQAATGLHYAHQMGLVHRDVKPENLLIRTDGAVKVLDFGLAMIGGSEAEYSLATILGQNCLGTADYIAPEQSIDSLNVDCRADIYSLGCTFYFLVTGQVPFPAKATAEKLAGHRNSRPREVRELNPKVPERIAKIIWKMTAKHPEHRFQTADEVRQILAPLAERKPIDFDFDAVLAKRAALAEQRLASESILRGDSRVTTVSKLDIPPPAELQRPRN